MQRQWSRACHILALALTGPSKRGQAQVGLVKVASAKRFNQSVVQARARNNVIKAPVNLDLRGTLGGTVHLK